MSEQAQQEQQEPNLGPELHLNLHLAEINFLVATLRKLPMEQSEGTVNKIRAQAQAGLNALHQAQALAAQTQANTGETK